MAVLGWGFSLPVCGFVRAFDCLIERRSWLIVTDCDRTKIHNQGITALRTLF